MYQILDSFLLFCSDKWWPHIQRTERDQINQEFKTFGHRIRFAVYTQKDESGIKSSGLVACREISNPESKVKILYPNT